jgi:hypothetical protein
LAEYVGTWPLPGIEEEDARECFVAQVIDSVRRVKYYFTIGSRDISENRINPVSHAFDPLRAAIFHKQRGNINEAFWLAFLSVHFGRNLQTRWRLLTDVYRGLGNSIRWDWDTIVGHVGEFREWLDASEFELKLTGKFGNHRKYENCSGSKPRGTGAAIASYVAWVGPNHDHVEMINRAKDSVGDNPRELFDFLYQNMNVTTFGRMGKFDYLTTIGKLGLVDIEPGNTYLKGATGPWKGVKVLFGNYDSDLLDGLLEELERRLSFPFGMQVLEDAICNWQKNPSMYKYFKG